jgi:hypothetical protein
MGISFFEETLKQFLTRGESAANTPRAKIPRPTGRLDPAEGEFTCVFVVGPSFNQDVPTAMMTFRMGYANAFESMGIPYVFVDQQDLHQILPELPKPFCMINGADYLVMQQRNIKALSRCLHSVWVDPWFRKSEQFFAESGLNSRMWSWTYEHKKKIISSKPTFVHTATVPTGLNFFEEWQRHGLRVISLPLACDTNLYQHEGHYEPLFEGIKLAFVGGYWESKGKQIDRYLRPFEDELIVFGYSTWPYRGYRGMLPRESEAALYRQAKLSPVINEPSVSVLKGQINERIYKVLGSGGVPLVDAVASYRELFSAEELPIPRDVDEFIQMARTILKCGHYPEWCRLARNAVMARHTYQNRARTVLKELSLSKCIERSNFT